MDVARSYLERSVRYLGRLFATWQKRAQADRWQRSTILGWDTAG
jgi:hypothetical protein